MTDLIRIKGNRSFSYDIAFSFAEENRGFVERVAELLRSRSVKVYYDDFERIENWGEDLRAHIHNVYLHEARFCMMFISEQYKQKYWAQFEHDRVKARSFFTKHKAYILPFKLDSTEIAGITDTLIYLTAEKLNEEQLADAIQKKIKKGEGAKFLPVKRLKDFLLNKYRFTAFVLIVMAIALLGISGIDFSEHVPSMSTLMKRTQAVKEWRFKAVCKDGWLSESRGPGTCSHHHGVHHYVDTVVYGNSKEECRTQSMESYGTLK